MNLIVALRTWLDGKKTYIGGGLLAGLAAMQTLDLSMHGTATTWLTGEQYLSLEALITGLTGMALRAAVRKSGPA